MACVNHSLRRRRQGVMNAAISTTPTARDTQARSGNGSPSTNWRARKYIVQVVATQPVSTSARVVLM